MKRLGYSRRPRALPPNYRAYGGDHLARLSFIRRARDLGFTLEAVRELLTLSDNKEQSCEAVDGIARVASGRDRPQDWRPDRAAFGT
jgi:DNA-binding transcriptional MerR regulator